MGMVYNINAQNVGQALKISNAKSRTANLNGTIIKEDIDNDGNSIVTINGEIVDYSFMEAICFEDSK